MRTSIIPMDKLSISDLQRCWQLCEPKEDYGYTRWAIKRWLEGIYPNRWAVVCRHEGRIVGWALVTKWWKGPVDFKIFVDETWRRKGIGRRLVRAARKRFGELQTYSPDDGATTFWLKVEE